MVKKKILVTGGAGFIGSHLVNRLIAEDQDVTVIDNLIKGSKININPDVNFYDLDLSIERAYDDLPLDFDLIFHLAAQVSNEASYENPRFDLDSNSLSSLLLLEWAKKTGVKEFVFSSTMGLYKDNLGYAVNEESPIEPKGFYGINKRSVEEYLRVFSDEGLQVNILRLFNVYGPGQNMMDLKQGMLSIYMSYIWKGLEIEVKGPVDRERDFVHVDDVVEAFILCGFGKNFGNIFNICTGRKTSVAEALMIIKNSFGVTQDYPTHYLNRTSRDIDSIYGDFTKIKKELGWEPKIELESGIKSMVEWLSEQKIQK